VARGESGGGWAPWVGVLAFSAVVVWFWSSPALWPVKLCVVLFHELSHAIAAWATGGTVLHIELNANQGGATQSAGGWPLVILNAGYVGSLIWGVALLWMAKSPDRARWTTTLLGVMLGGVALWFVRPIASFGFAFALSSAAALFVLSRLLPGDILSGLIRALGLFSVLYALFDIRDDVFGGAGPTDASMLAELTHVPAMAWGVGWLAASALLLFVLRRQLF
jgi:hypothetical protein